MALFFYNSKTGIGLADPLSDGKLGEHTPASHFHDYGAGWTHVVSAGGNDFNDDILAMVDPIKAAVVRNTVKSNLVKIADNFKDPLRYAGGATIVLLTVHDPTDGRGNLPALSGLDGFCKTIQGPVGLLVGGSAVTNLVALDDEIKKLGQRSDVRVVDNHGAFLGHGYHHADATLPSYHASDPTLWFSNDCAHLNDRGHHEVRRLIWHALFNE